MSELDDIPLEEIIHMKKFHHLFQPVYDFHSWQVFGYEALLRCQFFQNPESLFQLAIKQNSLFEMDTCSIQQALTTVNTQLVKLFVNVFPSTLCHPAFPDLLRKLENSCLANWNIIFEINESEKIVDMGILKNIIAFLKNRGYRIAIDDFGKGDLSWPTILQLEPDFVKLDRTFSIDLSLSIKKQDAIHNLLEKCQQHKFHLVLEGIENAKDLAMAKSLGIPFGQGYLLGKPSPINTICY